MTHEQIEEVIEKIEDLALSIECPWLLIDFKAQPSEIVCERCGEREIMRTGISLTYHLNLLLAFRLTHVLCEVKNATPLP